MVQNKKILREMTLSKSDASKDSYDAFRVQIRNLKLVSMWPTLTKNPWKNFKVKALLVLNSVILAGCTVGLFLKAVLTKDLVDRSEAMDIFTLTGSALYKMLFFYSHHEEMVDMINCGSGLTAHLPHNWIRHIGFFSNLHCSLGFICISFWGLCPLLKWMNGESDLKHMTLPMNIYDPFDSEGVLFSFFYLICYYGLISSCHIYMAVDGYLFSAIHVANGGITDLKMRLADIDDSTGNKTAAHPLGIYVNSMDRNYLLLKDCAKIHAHILTFIRKTDALFKSLFVVDVLHAIISLSFSMLTASESKGIFENIKMYVFVSYCFLHQFLNSYFGQRLIDEQDSYRKQLILSVPWPDASRVMRKTYHITITGCINSVKLSAWSVYFLQFETFVEFVRTMISYSLFLRQVKDQT